MSPRRLVVVGPLPPPIHGVTLSTQLVLSNPVLNERFSVEHVDTSDHRTGGNIGRWDVINVVLALKHLVMLGGKLAGPRGTLYLPLSQSRAALVRDLLFVDVAALLRWRVAAHLRGGEFRGVYATSNGIFRAWIRSSLRRIDSLAVMGESLRVLFDGLVAAERIAVVPNGTPDEGFSTGGDATRVLFLSNLRRRKGVVEAVEAACLVAEQEPSARFDFVGEWEDQELERDLRTRAAVADGRIVFSPPVFGEAKSETFERAGLLLFPPREPEGHPRVVLEALAAGIPVVTTDRGAIADTIDDGICGFVLAEPDPAQLAERVLRLLRDDELRTRMSRAAREQYLTHFTQEEADQRLTAWLDEVAGPQTVAHA
jgi:glycosyltransferase involved in cell wall biosynthesis